MSQRATGQPPAASVPERPGGLYYGWYIVGAAGVAHFAGATLQGYGTGPFLVPMSEDLGWTRTEFILALTLGQFIVAFVTLLIGRPLDRRGARPFILVGALLAAAGLLATSQVEELWQWLLVRGVVVAVATGLAGGLVVSVMLAKWFVDRRGRAVGFATMGISLAGVLVPPLLTASVDNYGWRASWQLLAVVSLVLLVPAALVTRRQPEDLGLHPDGRSDAELRAGAGEGARRDFERSLTRGQAVRTQAMWVLIVAFGFGNLSLLALATQSIPYLTDSGFSRETAAAMLSLFAFPGVLTRAFWGLAAERISPRYLSAGSFLCIAAGLVVIIAGAQAGSVGIVASGFLLVGTGIAGGLPLQELLWATYFGRRHLGEVRSLAMPFRVMFGASGPILVSVYFDATGSYTGVFLAMAATALVGAALMLVVCEPALPPTVARTPSTTRSSRAANSEEGAGPTTGAT